MNAFEFLNKLNTFYPSNESDNVFSQRVSEYADSIVHKCRVNKCQYDFDRVFTYILENYKYKNFPSLPDILSALPYGKIYNTCASDQTVKRVINGMEYEFTVVPNHWENVKNIKELDTEIRRKKQKGDYYDTGEKSA